MDKIKLEKQEELLLQTEGKTKEENEQMLKKKGIWTYLEDIDEGLLDGRLLSGYISKERKENLGLDTLGALTKISGLNMMTKVAGINMNSKYAQKWMVLISSCIITRDQKDSKELAQSMLPPWMELNVIYYFDVGGFTISNEQVQNAPKGFIVTNDILDVMEEDLDKDYLLKLNVGERIYVFSCQTSIERDQWVKAIKRSIANQKKLASRN